MAHKMLFNSNNNKNNINNKVRDDNIVKHQRISQRWDGVEAETSQLI